MFRALRMVLTNIKKQSNQPIIKFFGGRRP